MRKPLEGLFVVEMTSYWSATTTARFLRDMGARVVRVETPPIGDFCRYYGRSMGMPITAEENPIHDIFNGGKECVALDLKDPKNLKLMQNMLAKADVFITSTRTAGLKKLGLDWETLHAKYPKLVMGQVTGYGINGPLVNRPGIDAIAYFGANGVILDTRTDPDSPPIYPPAGMGDTTTGITLLSGVLAALLAAHETGVGDYVMTSLYGTGNFVTAGFATNCNYGYEWPREAHTMSPLGQGYKCRDGRYIYVFVNDYFEVSDRYLRPVLSVPPNICNDPVILRSYIANGMFYSFAGCYFPGRLPTMVDQELFRCFTEQLDHYFRETGFYSQSMPQRQQMIHDLLRYGEENPELVRDRARGLRLPETGDFRLGYVEFDEQASTSKAGYMVLQLRAWSNVANYGVMQYQNSVLILFQDWHDYLVGEQLLFRERWDELLTLLGKNHAHIGVSLLFTELGRLRMGYDQARTAIEIGRKLDPDALEYHYSKYYLNDMLECYREKFALDDVIVRYLDQLAGERGYSNSNLLLLYHYLNTERNISLTAKRVHMHRNSVIYRLQRIQDVLNLDLDDPDVRLRLMITFKILRMEGKLPEITDEPPEPDNGGSDRLTLVE